MKELRCSGVAKKVQRCKGTEAQVCGGAEMQVCRFVEELRGQLAGVHVLCSDGTQGVKK